MPAGLSPYLPPAVQINTIGTDTNPMIPAAATAMACALLGLAVAMAAPTAHAGGQAGMQCDEPKELYLVNTWPVCLSPGTVELLMDRGIDLVSATAQGPLAELGLSAEEAGWLEENPVIRVAHDPGWFPIEYADEHGQVAGVTLDYITEFERLTGADLRAVPTEDWSGALQAIQDRSADAMFMVAHTAERAEYMGFTEPHHHMETRLVSLEEGPLSLDEPGLRVLTIRNYEIEDWLEENRPDVGYISVDGFAEGLAMLRDGQADAFAATWPVLRAVAETEGMTVYNAGPTGHSYPLAVGYRGDQPVLGSILQKALDASPPLLAIFEGSGPSWTAEEERWLEENPVIRVTYDPGWFPIEYTDEDGRLAGATAAYVAEFERITGADFQAVHVADWSGALQAARDGDADTLFMVVNTAERSEYLGFTEPHFNVESVLITTQDRQLSLDEPGLRVLTIRDYAIEDWLDENRPDVGYVSVGSFAEGLAMLREGSADAMADVWQVVSAIAEIEGMTVYNAGPTGYSYDLSIGYRGDQPVLGSILQKALDSIPESTLERLQGTTPGE